MLFTEMNVLLEGDDLIWKCYSCENVGISSEIVKMSVFRLYNLFPSQT